MPQALYPVESCRYEGPIALLFTENDMHHVTDFIARLFIGIILLIGGAGLSGVALSIVYIVFISVVEFMGY